MPRLVIVLVNNCAPSLAPPNLVSVSRYSIPPGELARVLVYLLGALFGIVILALGMLP